MNVNGFALVVGAGSGIGQECALTFAERGAKGVAFADLNLDSATATAKQAEALRPNGNFTALALQVDVADRESVQRMVDATVKAFGRIDYAVNSAGVPRPSAATIQNVSIEDYDRLMNVNAKGILHCLQAQIEVMVKQEHGQVTGRNGTRSTGPGSIINITSTSGVRPVYASLTYTASKHTAQAIVKQAAMENFKSGLRINAVAPGWVDTPMLRNGLVQHPELKPFIASSTPLGRAALPEEVADVVHFLSSAGASYVNGQTIIIDSGSLLS